MNVIRFVGLEEFRSLVENGTVEPSSYICHNTYGKGVVKDRPVLYLFPFVSEEDFQKRSKLPDNNWKYRELDSPRSRLEYVACVVADCTTTIDGARRITSICLHLELPDNELIEDVQPYADPLGNFFDRMPVTEYLFYSPYNASDVKKVELYLTHATNPSEALLGVYATPRDALAFLEQHSASRR